MGVTERYRHRYHVNRDCVASERIVAVCDGEPAIMVFPGVNGPDDGPGGANGPDGAKAWRALGVQFHPEYSSRNNKPHPIFIAFLERLRAPR